MLEDNQENKELASDNTSSDRVEPEHIYFEVGNDLMSKPTALADLIQTSEGARTQIFCNSPSEADMVDVILKKRGIVCGKLIGHVPYTKTAQTLHQLSSGEINAIIVTDVSAEEIDPGQFDLTINYAIHEDPEIYLHRITPHGHESRLTKVYSLVSPLDFGNFHYLKKVVDFEFSKGTLPTKEEVSKKENDRFLDVASQSEYANDEAMQALIKEVLAHEKRDAILGYLLHNSLVVIPELSSRTSRSQDDNGGDDRRNGRGGRYDRNERGNGRRDPRSRRYEDDGDEERRPMRAEYVPPKRDVRFYLGQGLSDGLTDKELRDTIESAAEISGDDIKRLSIRDHYTFVDFDEEQADTIIAKLQETEFPNVGKLFIRKATVINAPRERNTAEDDEATEEDAEMEASYEADIEATVEE